MAETQTLQLEPLSPTVGAQVVDVDVARLRDDDDLPDAVSEALERYGALLFRDLHVDDESQIAFSRKLGPVRTFKNREVPELFEVSWNRDNPWGEYLRGNVTWHFDGVLDQDVPTKATMLSAKAVSETGGETDFASSYNSYELLTDEERSRYEDAEVLFTYEASQRRVFDNPTEEQVAGWKDWPTRVRPLVWNHRNGRKSLVLSSTMSHIVGMDPEEGRAVLEGLMARATTPEFVYRHTWEVGDTVIFDNEGLFHRAVPYDPESGRRLIRTTVLGTEPIT